MVAHIDRLERTLREREQFTKSLFEQSSIGLNLCQMDGLWVRSNPAFLKIIGYSAKEADGGLTYWELTPPEYAEEEKTQLERLKNDKVYGPYEKEFIRKDGSRVPVRLNGFVVEIEGKEYIWSFIEDISREKEAERRRREVERQLLQASKLASVGTLAGGIAHEINNPLAIALGYLDQIERKLQQEGTVEPETLRRVQSSLGRIQRIVRGLGFFIRKQTDATSESYEVNQAIQDALELLGPMLRAEGVQVALDLDAKESFCFGRLGSFDQVLINLFSNAKDALQGQKPKKIQVKTRRTKNQVVIQVWDNGPGIPENQLLRIFDSFYSTKEVGKGMGLGLSIVHSIVESMRGRICATSKEGEGTMFTITLPAQSKGVVKEEPARTSHKNLKFRGKVLVVDDEKELRKILCGMLEELGFLAKEAGSGEEALEALQIEAYDYVLTDLKMPGLTGEQLVLRIMREFGEKAPRLLVISGNVPEDLEQQLQDVRPYIDGVLQKPFSLDELGELFVEAVRRSSTLA